MAEEDWLSSTADLDASQHKEGYDQGYADGLAAGKEEAKPVGLQNGFEVGEELGFYRGCSVVWNSAIRADSTRFTKGAQKGVRKMEELIEKYPLMEPENESVQEVMRGLRLQFKLVCGSMGKRFEYKGYPKADSEF